MSNVKDTLRRVKNEFKSAGIGTWGIDADLLVMKACGLSRIQLVTHDMDEVTEEQEKLLNSLLKKRLKFMPMQYILGHCEFMGLDFAVNKNVLIPRPDTEILVEEVLKLKPESVLDIGTGSGAIAVSLAKYGVKNVTAADISLPALETAKLNAAANGVEINFIYSDLFENVTGCFDAVVSNPPYIESSVIPTLDSQVKDYEPLTALDGGKDGLDFYKKIVLQAKNFLNKNGSLAFEIGSTQGKAVEALMLEAGFNDVKISQDLAGLDRVVCGIFRY